MRTLLFFLNPKCHSNKIKIEIYVTKLHSISKMTFNVACIMGTYRTSENNNSSMT